MEEKKKKMLSRVNRLSVSRGHIDWYDDNGSSDWSCALVAVCAPATYHRGKHTCRSVCSRLRGLRYR